MDRDTDLHAKKYYLSLRVKGLGSEPQIRGSREADTAVKGDGWRVLDAPFLQSIADLA